MKRALGKRTAALLLTLCMAFMLLPATAFAASEYVIVGSAKLDDGCYTIDGITATQGASPGYGAAYNNGVLTLSSFTFPDSATARYNESMILKQSGDLTIELIGPNTVTYRPYSPSGADAFGVWVAQNLTIRGSGSLTVNTLPGTTGGTGIYAGHAITIGSNVNVSGYTRGIHGGDVTIYRGAEVHAAGAAGESKGIAGSSVTISGTNTTVVASATGTTSDSFGIGIEGGSGSTGHVTISGTNVSVTATGGRRGIYGGTGNLTFSTDAHVIAIGSECAIYRGYDKELTLNYSGGYQWRTANTGSYTQSADTAYTYDYVSPPAYFEVAPVGSVPVSSVDLPVSTIASAADPDYVLRSGVTAKFTPNTSATLGTPSTASGDGVKIDYYHPMLSPTGLTSGYSKRAEYNIQLPLINYNGTSLAGKLTLPLPSGCDGASAKIVGGAAAVSCTANTVIFPVTLTVNNNTATLVGGIMVEYKAAYTATVNGSYAATSGAGMYTKGATVNIDAGSRGGYAFDGWTANSDGVVFADSSGVITTFPMPAGNVVVTANWRYDGGAGGGAIATGGSAISGAGGYAGNAYPGAWGLNGALTVQGDYDKLISVVVDNVLLTRNTDYLATRGSTVIEFTPAYLATLKDGAHAIRVQFTDGQYTGSFTTPLAAALAVTGVPATGTCASLAGYYLLALAAACTVLRFSRRERCAPCRRR